MAIIYKLFPDRKLVLVDARGTVTVRDILEYMDSVFRDIRKDSDWQELIDPTQLKAVSLTYEEMHLIIEGYRQLDAEGSCGKTALVAREKALYGTGRMAQTMSEQLHRPFRVFRNRKDALRFLGAEDMDLPDTLFLSR